MICHKSPVRKLISSRQALCLIVLYASSCLVPTYAMHYRPMPRYALSSHAIICYAPPEKPSHTCSLPSCNMHVQAAHPGWLNVSGQEAVQHTQDLNFISFLVGHLAAGLGVQLACMLQQFIVVTSKYPSNVDFAYLSYLLSLLQPQHVTK